MNEYEYGTSAKQSRQNTKKLRQQPWQTTLRTTWKWKTFCILTDILQICTEFVRYKSINVNDNIVEVFVLVRCALTKPLIQC